MRLRFNRRQVLIGAAAGATTLAMPGLSRAAARPVITHGVQSGDMTRDGAMIWARADRDAKMLVEVATTESFGNARKVQPLDVTSATNFAGKMALEGLPSDQEVFYRVRFVDLSDSNAVSEPVVGRFRTAPASARDVSFVWSGDTAGQGWGIDEARGGMKTYATMQRHRPDFFLHSGDLIYADGPLVPEVTLEDGTIWRNLVTPEKSKVAETLDEFRGNFLYNMLDENVRAFSAQTPIIAQWDDHETHNNWDPYEIFVDDDRYTVKSAALLSARANRAMREMMPMRESAVEPGRVYRKVAYGPHLDVFVLDFRTYRGPNTANDQSVRSDETSFLGREQLAWLKRELTASTATWKVFAADMPIGLMVRDGKTAFENGANGDGPVRGREFDIAELLSFLRNAGIRNTVWLTADVHYTAAHHYSPERAQFQDFDPFWEFVSGPLHSGSFGPGDLDNTFGPQAVFTKDPAGKVNLPPSAGLQFFGKVDIEGATGAMTVSLMDVADTVLWSKVLEPAQG
jgi:alkaline phosphatase D